MWTTTYPGGMTEVLGYDKAGNITSRKNRRNQTIAYAYDALNRLDTKTPPDTGLVDYAYDTGSRLTDVTDSNGTTHYAYVSGVNRLQSVTYGYGGPAPRVVSYLYDQNGNRIRLTYPGGDYVTYVWDELNRLDQVKDSSESVITDYTYDKLSRRQQVDLMNGTTTDYDYDDINRLLSLVNKKVTPETIFSEYLFGLYDDVGNLKQMSRDGDGYTFGYDTIYQLKTTDYPEGHHSTNKTYDYDALGNRTSITNGGLESYTTNNLNQYTYVSGTAFSYDNSGNLISDGTNTYAYDSENRLTSATMGSGTFTYTYDPFGRRTRKQGPGMDVTYVYDNNQVIEERDSGGAVIATYVYGPGIDECISMERGGETYYYHYDRLGSVVNLSNSSGNLVETYHYDAWGNADTYGSVDNHYFFTGRRYDPETENYYYRARYYKPSIGRFLQTDPLGYYDGPNLYTYVTNNPVNFIDPYGLCKNEIPKAPPGVNIDEVIAQARLLGDTGPLGWYLFYRLVRKRGYWDYKVWYGIEYEAFGNWIYGATGAAAGFSLTRLKREAGRVQENPRPEWGKPGAFLNPWGGTGGYGDEPKDIPVTSRIEIILFAELRSNDFDNDATL